jgi:hypothetical protein
MVMPPTFAGVGPRAYWSGRASFSLVTDDDGVLGGLAFFRSAECGATKRKPSFGCD